MKHLKAVLLAALVVAAPRAGAVDVEPFIRKDKFQSIEISPNGDYFAATVPLEKQTILVIIRRSDNKVVSRFGKGENTVIGAFHWVNPERVIFSAGEKFGALDRPSGTGELYAISAKEGATAQVLVGYGVANGAFAGNGSHNQAQNVAAYLLDDLPDDDRNVLIQVSTFDSEFPRVEEMDVYSGRRIRVANAPVRSSSFATDNAGVVRFAHGAEYDREGKLYYREGDDSEWRLVNDEGKTGLDRWPVGFSADNKIAYLEVESAHGPNRIVSWNPATDRVTELLSDDSVDPVNVIVEVGSSVPVGAYYRNGRLTSKFFDTGSRAYKLQRGLEQAFAGQDVFVTSETKDGATALVYVSSDQNPGDYYLFDTIRNKADYLLSNGDWFDPDRMNPTLPVVFAARDGLQVHGFLTRPKGSEGRRLPMVVYPHGGPFGVQDDGTFDKDVQMLAAAGYAVFQVNYRGSSGYGRDFQEAGRKQWGKSMQDDLTDATRWAIAQGHADAKRICIYGASYGGYAALMGAAKEPDLYRCAAGYVGVYDLPALYTDGEGHKSAYTKNFLADWVGPREDIAAVSPSRLGDRIKVPVFLAAGGEDETAPIAHTKMMERSLISAGVPVETLYVSTEGHGFYTEEHRREFYTKLLAFLAKNIGGEVATTSAGSASNAK
ncbi:alpha/beta hydrolase family protein [Lysobacter claricitrinus]|uniref:alpha/beta hydrolase family protein n=1 Tax=Lysobacter claricitrinus TaxID=3367728 RepID=UPI0037DB347F